MSCSGSEDFERIRDLEASYEALYQFVRSTFPLKLKRWTDAEDILQETLIEAWKYGNSNPDSSPSSISWLRTVARRKIIDCIRRYATQKRSIELQEPLQFDVDSEGVHAPEPSARLEQLEAGLILAEAISQLSTRHRKAISMRFFEGLTYADVADGLDITPRAAQMLVRRSIENLRRNLAPYQKQLHDV